MGDRLACPPHPPKLAGPPPSPRADYEWHGWDRQSNIRGDYEWQRIEIDTR